MVIIQDEEAYFIAEVPVLRSCFTQGKTKEEAMSNIKEVIYLSLESMAEIGETIPDKYTLEQVEVMI